MNSSFYFYHHAVHKAGGTVTEHRHQCHEIVYYCRGCGRSVIGGISYPYEAGQYALIPANVVHEEYHDEETEVMFVGFTENMKYELPVGLYSQGHLGIQEFMVRFREEFLELKPLHTSMLELLVQELEIGMIRTLRIDMCRDERKQMIAYAIKYINEHLGRTIDVRELASTFGYSYDRFRHLFKESTGVSLTQYVMRKRIDLACKLLAGSEHLLTSIASECGFATDSKLCHYFRRETGMTPLQYRKASGQQPMLMYSYASSFA